MGYRSGGDGPVEVLADGRFAIHSRAGLFGRLEFVPWSCVHTLRVAVLDMPENADRIYNLAEVLFVHTISTA